MNDDFELKHWILVDGKEVEADLETWAKWLGGDHQKRRVDLTKVKNLVGQEITVSTVFLGLDHGFGDGPPVLYETMIFGGPYDSWQWRYCSWEEAVRGHGDAVRMVEGGWPVWLVKEGPTAFIFWTRCRWSAVKWRIKEVYGRLKRTR